MKTRSWPKLGAIALSALVVVACSDEATGPRRAGPTPSLVKASAASQRGLTDRHVIVLTEGGSTDLRAAVQALGGQVVRTYGAIGVVVARGLSDAAAAKLAARPGVEGVARDVRLQMVPPRDRTVAGHAVRLQSDQSGAAFFPGFQWNLRVIQADDAWLASNQGAGALVCILDTGIDPTHLDLVGKVDLLRSRSFVESEPFIEDLHFHGTAIASIISSRGIGVASVAPDARLCAVKLFDRFGVTTPGTILAGIMYASDVGADVINMSFGDYLSRKDEGVKEYIRALQRAIDYAKQRGALSVASAGNNAANLNTDGQLILIPAELNHVVSVGATGPVSQQNFDQVASYSNFGKKGVDIFAPGGDFIAGQSVLQDLILSACSSFSSPVCADKVTYLFWAGTSAAAPHVAGAAAVVESTFPGDQRGERLAHCVIASADRLTGRGRDPIYGKGRLNVLGAAECRRLH